MCGLLARNDTLCPSLSTLPLYFTRTQQILLRLGIIQTWVTWRLHGRGKTLARCRVQSEVAFGSMPHLYAKKRLGEAKSKQTSYVLGLACSLTKVLKEMTILSCKRSSKGCSSIELRKLLVDNPIRVTHHKIFPEAEALFRRHCYTEIENIIECKRPPFALAFRSQLLRPIKGPA